MESQRGRILYFDYLRVFATFAVMLLHIASKFWARVPVDSYEWQCFNIYDGCVRWSVPVFVMISGALFLRSEIKIKKLYQKNILRIVTAFLFWSLVYALASYYWKGKALNDCIVEFVQGHYHLWFLFMIVGLYIISPLLRPIVQSEKLMEYFLFFSILFTMLIPDLEFLLSYLDRGKVEVFIGLLDKMNVKMVMAYSSYFVLGHYLNQKDLSKGWRGFLYLLGILGFVSTVLLTATFSQFEGVHQEHFYSFFSANVLMESVGVFVFFKYHVGRKRSRMSWFMMVMALCSFGAYLVHTLLIERMYEWIGIDPLSFNAALSVPTLALAIFVIAFVIAFLLKLIPVVRHYIV